MSSFFLFSIKNLYTVRKTICLLALATYMSVSFNVSAQKPKRYNSSEIQLMLEKLKVLGNVLYVAAHPDDENTGIIAYFANERKVNTAYFSFTRGDGGQNLIGPEIREELGLIRTNELLQAREMDNGIQFFSRAVDFGYSKHPDETFNIWDKDKVLGDLVWVIRKFRPDVIITRFNTEPGATHGHHTASAVLAGEAMDIVGDATKYPEQLAFVETWQPRSMYWNAFFWRRTEYMKDTSELLRVDIGKYNKLLGLSYSELAALSRSSHKSQGFGVTGSRGRRLEYLQLEKGYQPGNDVFEGIDISWGRVKGGDGVDKKIDAIIAEFDPKKPSGILDNLISLKTDVSKLKDEFWRDRKSSDIDELIYAVAGLYLEVKAGDYTAYPGETLDLDIEAINRSDADIVLESVQFDKLKTDSRYQKRLINNVDETFKASITLPEDMPYSQPYWLVYPNSLGMFQVRDQQLIGKPVNGASLKAEFVLSINGEKFSYSKPVVFKRNDPVQGEVYRPFVVGPPVFVNIAGDVNLFANHRAQKISVSVRAGKNNVRGKLTLSLPETWKVVPEMHNISIDQKYGEETYEFDVTPPEKQEIAFAKPIVSLDGKEYSYSLTEINYDHIPSQMLFNDASSKFVKLELTKGHEKIGYIMGAGDNIPENLRQIGYEVDLINDMGFDEVSLDRYDVIVLGIRALNTVERLKFDMEKLLSFVERGGTLIVQYNTNHALITDNIAPYPLQLSRERITVEEAPVTIVNPEHPLLNYPNKIDQHDFDGWVQERGLYFPEKWADEFTPVISSHDPGEGDLAGGTLVASYGKGYYIYTGYSWFRELPAGVPGAYRLFVNMISIGK
jgi:LmbE family N-acetylglucosaminyl deacetylase